MSAESEVSELLRRATEGFDEKPLASSAHVREAYYWLERPRAFRAAAVTPGGQYLLQVVLDEPDVDYAQQLLELACREWTPLLGQESPIRVAYGFAPTAFQFDAIAALHPDVHGFHKTKLPALHARTFWLAGAYSCEVMPGLTVPEAAATLKGVRFIDRARPRQGIARAHLVVGGVRTKGSRRSLTAERQLLPYVRGLEGDATGHIELENARGELAELRWEREYRLKEGASEVKLTDAKEAVERVREFVRRLVSTPSVRPGGGRGNEGIPLLSTMTLSMEDGTAADQLSDWQLRDELDRLAPSSGSQFAVLKSAPEDYIQTYARADGLFDVEYREGSAAKHFSSESGLAIDDVKEMFVAYGLGDGGWKKRTGWRRV